MMARKKRSKKETEAKRIENGVRISMDRARKNDGMLGVINDLFKLLGQAPDPDTPYVLQVDIYENKEWRPVYPAFILEAEEITPFITNDIIKSLRALGRKPPADRLVESLRRVARRYGGSRKLNMYIDNGNLFRKTVKDVAARAWESIWRFEECCIVDRRAVADRMREGIHEV